MATVTQPPELGLWDVFPNVDTDPAAHQLPAFATAQPAQPAAEPVQSSIKYGKRHLG